MQKFDFSGIFFDDSDDESDEPGRDSRGTIPENQSGSLSDLSTVKAPPKSKSKSGQLEFNPQKTAEKGQWETFDFDETKKLTALELMVRHNRKDMLQVILPLVGPPPCPPNPPAARHLHRRLPTTNATYTRTHTHTRTYPHTHTHSHQTPVVNFATTTMWNVFAWKEYVRQVTSPLLHPCSHLQPPATETPLHWHFIGKLDTGDPLNTSPES